MKKSFIFILTLALISTNSLAFPKPQGWFSSFVSTGANAASNGLKLGNSAIQMGTAVKGNAIQTGTNMAKSGTASASKIGSQGLQGFTNTIEQGLDAANSLLKGVPVIGDKVNMLTSLGKTGIKVVNEVGQPGIKMANEVVQEVLSAVNAAGQLKTQTISNIANIVTDIGQNGIMSGASTLAKGLSHINLPQIGDGKQLMSEHMQKEMGSMINVLKNSAGQIASILKSEGMEIVEDVKNKVGNIIQQIGSLPGSIHQLTANIQSSRDKLMKIANDIQSVVQHQAGKSFSEQLKGLSENVGTILGQLGSTVGGNQGKTVLSDIGNHAGIAMKELGETIGGNSVQKVASTFNEIKNTIGHALQDLSGAINRGRTNSRSEIFKNVGEKVASTLNNVGTIVGGEKILGDMGEKIGNVMSGVSSILDKESLIKVENMYKNVGGQINKALGQVKNFVTSANRDDIMHIIKSNESVTKVLNLYGNLMNTISG